MRITPPVLPIVLSVLALCAGQYLLHPASAYAQNPDITLTQSVCGSGSPCVTTSHNDSSRDGVNPNETTLTALTVSGGLTWQKSVTTDGLIYAQPLYIHDLIGSEGSVGSCTGQQSVVFVATENDTVYTFDDTNSNASPCWSVSLLPSGEYAAPYSVTAGDTGNGCTNVVPEVGITGTPVIDTNITPPFIYVVAKSYDGTYIHERLHAISATTGADLNSIELSKCEPGAGNTCTGSLGESFNPQFQLQRPGLALYYNGSTAHTSDIYISWGSFCDSNNYAGGTDNPNTTNPYNGWVAEVQADYTTSSSFPTLSFVTSFSTEPTSPASIHTEGAIWMAGAAPAVDGTGDVFLASANSFVGSYSGGVQTNYGWNGSNEWGQSLLELSNVVTSGVTALGVTDFYTPNDWPELNGGNGGTNTQYVCQLETCSGMGDYPLDSDEDLGSGGVLLLSSTTPLGLTHPEIIGAGKEGMIYTTWYKPSNSVTSLGSNFNEYMGGLDGCGYHMPSGTGCEFASQASVPYNYGCTPGSGTGAGLLAGCVEGFFYPSTSASEKYGSRGVPAFITTTNSLDNFAYTWGSQDTLKAFLLSVSSGVGTFSTGTSHEFTAVGLPTLGYPGTTPSVTWDGSNFYNTVVWGIDTSGWGTLGMAATQDLVYAYSGDPYYGTNYCSNANMLCQLWCDGPSISGCTTQKAPGAVKFVVPTVVDGYVFIAGGNNDPFYWPGTTVTVGVLSTDCNTPTSHTSGPTNCGMLSIYY
jgi:hypothetical protein